MAMEVEYALYCPETVTECLTRGSSSFIGLVDDTTVLKYPLARDDKKALAFLELEARILQLIGPHKYIIGFKGLTESGLLLERAPFGSIAAYLERNDPALQQRLAWAYQATEALVAVHEKNVLHRDISVNNFSSRCSIERQNERLPRTKARTQWSRYRGCLSVECPKSFLPRADSNYADWMTDIFALGSAF